MIFFQPLSIQICLVKQRRFFYCRSMAGLVHFRSVYDKAMLVLQKENGDVYNGSLVEFGSF